MGRTLKRGLFDLYFTHMLRVMKSSRKENKARACSPELAVELRPSFLLSFPPTIRVDPPANQACSLLSRPLSSVPSVFSTQEPSFKPSSLCSIAPKPPPLPNLLPPPPPPLPSQPPTNPTRPNLDLPLPSSTHLPPPDFTLGRTLHLDRKRGSGSKRLDEHQAEPRRKAGVSGRRWFITAREPTGEIGLTVINKGGNLW